MSNQLKWYYDRLSKMSIPEISWRIKQKYKTYSYKNKYGKKKVFNN